MQLPYTVSGYSDFFKSGFRAFTNRACSPQIYLFSSPDATSTLSSNPTKRQPRPVSMIVQNTPREKARRRRTSFLSFSHLLDRKSTATSCNQESAISSTRSSTSSCAADSGDSLPEVWITAGGPFTLSTLNGSSTIDAIDPAKSPFADLSYDDPVLGSSTPKRDSSTFHRSPIMATRCERPSSIQIISPLQARQSPLQHHHRLSHHDKFDLEDSDMGPILFSSDDEDWDAPAEIDWRQFHVDVLTDDM